MSDGWRDKPASRWHGIRPGVQNSPPGGGNQPLAYFNIPDSGTFTGTPAIAWEKAWVDDSGGFTAPREADEGYGGPTYSMKVSFWVRFNKEFAFDPTVLICGVSRAGTEAFCAVTIRNVDVGSGGIAVSWAMNSPWLGYGGIYFHSENVPVLFGENGDVILDKWLFIEAMGGSGAKLMILTESDTSQGTYLTPDSGGPSQIADISTPLDYNWRGVIGHERQSATDGLANGEIPKMDLCNMRFGYSQNYTPGWWAENYWKKQIDVDAERLTMVGDGMTAANAKKSLSYGYPFQSDYKCQGGYGPDFTPYSGSIIAGDGPKLD